MSKINIISGFLGAGKTTLIKKLLSETFNGEKLVLIENEFGDIGVDSTFLNDTGIQITEMNSGCICCSLVGDFINALTMVLDKYQPDRILIEPSGVGKLSDVKKAIMNVDNVTLENAITVVDVKKYKMYSKNFAEFFNDQIENAGCIILSRTQDENINKVEEVVKAIKVLNEKASIITTPWDLLDKNALLSALNNVEIEVSLKMHDEEHIHEHHHHHEDNEKCCEHEHHHHEDNEKCCEHEHHHHEENEECCEHEHHHHEDNEKCCEHEHHHHHEDNEECYEHHHHHEDNEECCEHEHHHHEDNEECCEHEHHHHEHEHHHHADEVFTSWGVETPHIYTKEKLESILKKLSLDEYGTILRAKGIVAGADNKWYFFDMVPNEYEIRVNEADYTGKICVIGSNINMDQLKALFELN